VVDAHLDAVLLGRREDGGPLLRDVNPNIKVGFVGAKGWRLQPDESLKQAPVIDFVGRNEFDFTIKEIAEGRLARLRGRRQLSQRRGSHRAQRRGARVLENMDKLPFVSEVYKRGPQHRGLLHRLPEASPTSSFYTGRGLQIALHLLPLAADRRRPSPIGNA